MTLSLLLFFLNFFLNYLNNYSFFFLHCLAYLGCPSTRRPYDSLDFSSKNFLFFFRKLSRFDISVLNYVK